jgi:predicted amidohydrolase
VAGDSVRAAVVQLLADEDTPRNIARAGELVQAAAVSGATLVLLPEKWNWWGAAARTPDGAESLGGPSLSAARMWAREFGITVVAGSILEATRDGGKAFNTSVLIAPDGRDLAIYRKIHLFDVTVGGHEYRESACTEPGDALATAQVAGMTVGLGSGATVLTVPANFTRETGRDHWEVLLRARAIEDQCFVLAAGQCGEHSTGEGAWGHSMIVDPWGVVLAEVPDGEGFACADLDLDRQRQVRESLPALRHRRLA